MKETICSRLASSTNEIRRSRLLCSCRWHSTRLPGNAAETIYVLRIRFDGGKEALVRAAEARSIRFKRRVLCLIGKLSGFSIEFSCNRSRLIAADRQQDATSNEHAKLLVL